MSYESFLSVIDDMPPGYTVEHFKNKIINLLALQAGDTLKHLKKHLHVANKLYIDLVVTLHENKPWGNGIDFYMAAARWFIGKPALFVRPMLNPKYQNGQNPPKFFFNKEYFFEEDSYMSVDKIHLCFVFNGINYYAPFFQQSVACIIRTGDPVLKNIMWASKDLKILMGKLSINAGLKQVSMYMDAASKIVQKTHLTCGNSPVFETMTMELPGIDPFLEGTVRRCRHKPEAMEPAKSSAAKK